LRFCTLVLPWLCPISRSFARRRHGSNCYGPATMVTPLPKARSLQSPRSACRCRSADRTGATEC
jgi:hypothetical protein